MRLAYFNQDFCLPERVCNEGWERGDDKEEEEKQVLRETSDLCPDWREELLQVREVLTNTIISSPKPLESFQPQNCNSL